MIEAQNKVVGQCESSHVDNIDSLVCEEHVPRMLRDCQWGDHVVVHVPRAAERIFNFRPGSFFVYTYLFTLLFELLIDPVIFDFCRHFNACLGQVGPNLWRLMVYFYFLVNIADIPFFPLYLLHLFSPKPLKGSIIFLAS